MQITYNQSELETIVTTHIFDTLPGVNPEDVSNVAFNDDGSVTIVIGEEVSHEDDTPPVVEKKQRRRRSNHAEAKHVPVEAKKELEQPAETQTSTGGPNGNSTQEAEVATPGAGLPNDPNGTKAAAESGEATQQIEDTAADEVAEEATAQEEVQEEKAAEAPAAKPSLFANLKR